MIQSLARTFRRSSAVLPFPLDAVQEIKTSPPLSPELPEAKVKPTTRSSRFSLPPLEKALRSKSDGRSLKTTIERMYSSLANEVEKSTRGTRVAIQERWPND